MIRHLTASAFFTVAIGCYSDAEFIDDPDLVPPGTAPVFADPRAGMETNGPWLLGEQLDARGTSTNHEAFATAAISASGNPVTLRFRAPASLEATVSGVVRIDDDPWFLGLRLVGPGTAEAKIVAVRTDGPLTLYTLRHRDSPTAPWVDRCAGGEAVVTSGVWARDGRHLVDSTRVTFACLTDTAIGKCLSWGYLPGAGPGASGWAPHLACTRMVRADVCGVGEANTLEGTTIGVYDYVGVNQAPPAVVPGVTTWPPPHTELFFDGRWGVDGATCAGKARWQSLAVGSPCPLVAPDPRTDIGADYCDDVAADSDSLLMSTATVSELGFHVWAKSGDQVGTLQGYYALDHRVAPFGDQAYQHVRLDGMLLRERPASIALAEVEEANSYLGPNGDRLVTTPSAVPSGFTFDRREGFVFRAAREGTRPLWRRQLAGNYLTTTVPPGAGETGAIVIGHIHAQ